jgi:hypothetical protein
MTVHHGPEYAFLAPVLKRDDQTFVGGVDLKAMLKAEADIWESMEEERHARLRWALHSPYPRQDSSLFHLWRQYMRVVVGGNRVCRLTDEQRQLALREATALVNEAKAGSSL